MSFGYAKPYLVFGEFIFLIKISKASGEFSELLKTAGIIAIGW